MEDKQIVVSNDLLLQLTYTFDEIHTLSEELGCKVSEIELSENDKKLPMENMPRNRYAKMLFLLASYTKLCSKNLQDEITKAGGEI